MDCLQIDWDTIDHTFVRDEFYENIQAPKWIDFTAPSQPVDDFEWFCAKSGCTHHDRKIEVIQEDIFPLQNSAQNVAKKPNAIDCGKKGRAMAQSCSVSSISEIKRTFTETRVFLHQSTMVSELDQRETDNKNTKKKPRPHVKLQQHHHLCENENPNKVQVGLSKIPLFGKPPELAHNKKMKMSENKADHVVREASGIPQKVKMFDNKADPIAREAPGIISQKARNLLGEASSSVVLQKADHVVREASGIPQKMKMFDNKADPIAREAPGIISQKARNLLGEASSSAVLQKSRNPCKESSGISQKAPNFGEASRICHEARMAPRISRKTQNPFDESFGISREKPTANAVDVLSKSSTISSGAITFGSKDQDKKPGGGGRRNVLTSSMASLKRSNNAEATTTKRITTTATMRSMHNLHLGNMKVNSIVSSKPPPARVVGNIKEDRHGFRVALPRCEKINFPQVARKVADSQRLGLCSVVSTQSVEDNRTDASPSSSPLSKVKVVNNVRQEEETLEVSLQMSLMNLNLGTTDNELAQANEKEYCGEKIEETAAIQSGITLHDERLLMEMRDLVGRDSADEMVAIKARNIESGHCAGEKLSTGMRDNMMGRNCSDETLPNGMRDVMGGGHSADEAMIDREYRDNVAKLQMPKQRKRTQGTKRKSSELNFKVNCSSKEHKVVLSDGRPLFSSTCYHQHHLLIKKSPTKVLANSCIIIDNASCKEQHKKLRSSTVQQTFKPFRFRTEERIALKENGFGKKEKQSNQDMRHHALRMPSFGHPFRPQRSNKKLTIPKEPKFHLSKARKACTKQVAVPPTTTT